MLVVDSAELRAELRASLAPEVEGLLHKGGEELTDAYLGKWLRARKGKLADAKRDLEAHARWRAEFVPHGRITEEEVKDEVAQNKVFLQGVDAEGHPVSILVAERHIPQNLEMCKRFICLTLDSTRQMGLANPNWDGKSISIFDLSGMTMANADLGALRAVFDLLQNHYPEGLYKLYLYEAPLLFYGLWKLVSPFVDPVTREKVVFVSKKEAAVQFAKAFPPGLLPAELGGTGVYRPCMEVIRSLPHAEASKVPTSVAVESNGVVVVAAN